MLGCLRHIGRPPRLEQHCAGTGTAKKMENMGLDIIRASVLMNGAIRLGLEEVKALSK